MPKNIKILLKSKADVNLIGKYRGPVLMYAARGGDNDIIKLLIKHGARLDVINSNGMSALDEAISREHPDTVKLLREFGAKTAKELEHKAN